MAQFDVYLNPSARSRDTFPYLVDIQSTVLSRLHTRLMLPLSRVGNDLSAGLPRRLAPHFVVDGERLSLLAHLGAAIEARHLRKPVASLVGSRHEIVDALDAVVSGV